MEIATPAKRVRIYIGEADRAEGKPLYEAIIMEARKAGLAGGTIFRSPMGFGKTSRLHTSKILQISMDLPIIVEIVDSEEKIRQFVETVHPMMRGGMVTLENVEVLHYKSKDDAK